MDQNVYFLPNPIGFSGSSTVDRCPAVGHSIQIVFKRGNMNHTKSVGLDQFDEHAMVSNFGNHCGKLGSLRLIQFPFEKFE